MMRHHDVRGGVPTTGLHRRTGRPSAGRGPPQWPCKEGLPWLPHEVLEAAGVCLDCLTQKMALLRPRRKPMSLSAPPRDHGGTIRGLFHSVVGPIHVGTGTSSVSPWPSSPWRRPTSGRLVFLGVGTPRPFGCRFVLRSYQAAGAERSLAYIPPFRAQTSPVGRVLMVTILQIRKLRPRAAQELAWSHSAWSWWQRRIFEPLILKEKNNMGLRLPMLAPNSRPFLPWPATRVIGCLSCNLTGIAKTSKEGGKEKPPYEGKMGGGILAAGIHMKKAFFGF